MRYDKNAISNTARNLRAKSLGLGKIQTNLSRVSPKKCSPSFYSKRSLLVRRLSNVQSEINSLSDDINNAASKMSYDDVQNAYYIRQVFSNRASKISYEQKQFFAGNTILKRNGVFGNALQFSQMAMNRRPVSSLGNASSGSIPWYRKAGNFVRHSATSIGEKVGQFGSKVWNGASGFFSNAGKWGSERIKDLRDWGKSAGEYTWKSITKFVLGDYSDDNITALSFTGNIVTGIIDADLPLDIRDLVYDIQHWGEGDNFGLYFALDVVALLPVIGAVKYCKYVDDVADGAKDIGKTVEAVGDVSKTGDVLWETARKRKYIFSDDTFKIVNDSGEVINEVKNVERVSDFNYVKKNAEDYAKQRKEFNTIYKESFLKKIATDNSDELKKLGLSDDQIKDMLEGVQPKGYEVHHKFSLDDGGDNSFENLILIDDKSHEMFTGYQNAFTKKDTFKTSGSMKIDWIYPTGSIYFSD